MAHAETPPYEGMEPFDTFLFDWDSENNNEPFWRKSHLLDLEALAHDRVSSPTSLFRLWFPVLFRKPNAPIPSRVAILEGAVSGLFMGVKNESGRIRGHNTAEGQRQAPLLFF